MSLTRLMLDLLLIYFLRSRSFINLEFPNLCIFVLLSQHIAIINHVCHQSIYNIFGLIILCKKYMPISMRPNYYHQINHEIYFSRQCEIVVNVDKYTTCSGH